MALRGDYLTIRVDKTSSGISSDVIAESTSVSVAFSAQALETTSQTAGLNASYIAGKVDCVISGDFLLASDAAQFTDLFTHMNAGELLRVQVYTGSTPTKRLDGNGVLTSLTMTGGNSDQLVTGAYSIQCSGNMA